MEDGGSFRDFFLPLEGKPYAQEVLAKLSHSYKLRYQHLWSELIETAKQHVKDWKLARQQ
jgi:hypothetical protein